MLHAVLRLAGVHVGWSVAAATSFGRCVTTEQFGFVNGLMGCSAAMFLVLLTACLHALAPILENYPAVLELSLRGIESASALLQRMASQPISATERRGTLLHVMTLLGHPSGVAELLLAKSCAVPASASRAAYVNQADGFNMTALHYAAVFGRSDIL